jgi:hypothetical protein
VRQHLILVLGYAGDFMGSLVVAFFVILAIVVVPIMLAARFVGAGKTGFGSCLFAAFMLAVVSALTNGMIGDGLLSSFVNAMLGAIVFMFVLDTTFVKGLCISVLATVIVFFAMLALAGTLIVSAT